ncbi:hypothetical protein L227DRAFT_347623 [Lentinus tigrinus ALCF2SS1-6]|uniref:Uncharacterized protein n=1 Tax=Lentinus tigrinus ALCF2SS1-6 TaxID=1328759 RepID=A0A5C2RV73_9APHY|nr:hypothetical protein L227DRAFT_347623 [Lentinus tigrinus ALCF2SS1-6]
MFLHSPRTPTPQLVIILQPALPLQYTHTSAEPSSAFSVALRQSPLPVKQRPGPHAIRGRAIDELPEPYGVDFSRLQWYCIHAATLICLRAVTVVAPQRPHLSQQFLRIASPLRQRHVWCSLPSLHSRVIPSVPCGHILISIRLQS